MASKQLDAAQSSRVLDQRTADSVYNYLEVDHDPTLRATAQRTRDTLITMVPIDEFPDEVKLGLLKKEVIRNLIRDSLVEEPDKCAEEQLDLVEHYSEEIRGSMSGFSSFLDFQARIREFFYQKWLLVMQEEATKDGETGSTLHTNLYYEISRGLEHLTSSPTVFVDIANYLRDRKDVRTSRYAELLDFYIEILKI